MRCPHSSNPRIAISVHGTNVFNKLLNFVSHGMRNSYIRLQWANNTFDTVNITRKYFDSQNLIMQDRGQDMDLKNDAEIKQFGWFLHFTTKWLFEVLRLHLNCPRTGSLPRSIKGWSCSQWYGALSSLEGVKCVHLRGIHTYTHDACYMRLHSHTHTSAHTCTPTKGQAKQTHMQIAPQSFSQLHQHGQHHPPTCACVRLRRAFLQSSTDLYSSCWLPLRLCCG